MNKSFVNHKIRNYEDEFFELLEKLQDFKNIENIESYKEIFNLLGDFKVFSEEIAQNFIEYEENSMIYEDFNEIIEKSDNFKNIKIFHSKNMNILLNCVIFPQETHAKNDILEENEEYLFFQEDFKQLSNIFHGYEYLMGGILSLNTLTSHKNRVNFRIPLTSLITYKGYKLLIMTWNPLLFSKEFLLIQGFSEGCHRVSTKFMEDVQILAESLGIPPRLTVFTETNPPISVGLAKELDVYENTSIYAKKCYYLINPINILPQDPKFMDKHYCKLRSEAILGKKSSFFTGNGEVIEISNEIDRKIKEELIPQMENLKKFPLESETLSEILHDFGVNIRNLGYIYENTKQIYMKELIFREIVARTCKNILNNHVQSSKNIEQSSKTEEIAIDFLNLLFGFGQETDVFWLEIFPKEAYSCFHIYLKISQTDDINESLFRKILYTCLVEIESHTSLIFPLKEETPFIISDFKAFQMKFKGYSFKNWSFIEEIRKRTDLGKTNDFMDCFNANLQLFSLQKSLGNFCKADDFGLNLCELYLRNLNFQQTKTSLIKLLKNTYYISSIRAQIRGNFLLFKAHIGVNEIEEFLSIFAKLLNMLEVCFGPFHPMHILIYKELAIYYKSVRKFDDAIFLTKNALICALRILGNKHWIIGDLYELLAEIYLSQEDKESSLFYFQKAYILVKRQGLGYRIAELLLGMNQIIEAKTFFIKILKKSVIFDKNSSILKKNQDLQKTNKPFDEFLQNRIEIKDIFEKNIDIIEKIDEEELEIIEGKDFEALVNLSHISLILNEVSEAEKWLKMALELKKNENFMCEYEEKLIKLAFFLCIQQITYNKRKYLWIISRSLIEFHESIVNPLNLISKEAKNHWNLLEFLKDFFEELTFICDKNDYINDGEFWRLYLKNIQIKDPHNIKKSLKFVKALIEVIGEKVFIEELMK